MKVVFLARRYLPHIGGVEIHIEKLVEALGGDINVTVVTELHSPELKQKEKIGQVTVLRIPLPKQETNKWSIWWWWMRHLHLIFGADVVHIHDVFFWLLPFRWLFFWKRVFMTFHGYEGALNPTWKQIMWHQIAEVCTSGNICIGGFHQKWYGVNPDFVSYGAVDSSQFKAKTETDLLQKKTKLHVAYVGRLAADTGILVYLEALKILSSKYQIHLDVFGDGPDKSLAEAYVSQYSLDVFFHGFVPQNQVKWLKYDVAFVSRYLAILESFCSNIPVVAQYNIEIKRDYLQLTPFKNWLVSAQTTQELVQGFEKIVSSDISEPKKLAKDWAEQQTWKQMAEVYKSLWEKSA